MSVTSQLERFKFTSLGTTSSPQIRLLKVKGRAVSGHIECSLRTYAFTISTRGSRAPQYRALSYAWGALLPQIEIIVNDQMYSVSRNLYDFLHVAEETLEGRACYYWIDQICINQSDVEERNRIVANMPEIYTRAFEVILWLGDSADDSSYAMDLLRGSIRYTGSELDTVHHPWSGTRTQREKKALGALLTREYWNRLWIVQELSLARSVSIQCGRDRIDPIQSNEKIVLDVSDEVYYTGPSNQTSSSYKTGSSYKHKATTLIDLANVELQYWSWSALIEQFGKQRCSDLRDRIFGLQGCVAPEYRIEVDYALPPEHLIFRLFDSVMEQEGQIAAWDWLSLEKPRMFAKALFGSDYPFGVLMVLQAYVWSLAFVYVFDTRKKCTREAIRSFLAQARTVQHRQLADRILTSLDLSDEARTLSQDVLELIQILVIEHGFDIGEGHLRHREEPPFVKLLERALHGRSWDTALTMWSPNSFGALVGSNSTLCDFSRRPVSSLDSEFASESDSDSTHEDFANLQPQSPGLN